MRILALLVAGAIAFGAALPGHSAAPPPGHLEIGLLLIAIDVQPDHLRISEGFRVSNIGAPTSQMFAVGLPPDATYLAYHRGLHSPRRTESGFVGQVRFVTGVTEIAYSYALPAPRDMLLSRTFPLNARRVEVAIRERGVHVAVRDGVPLPPMPLGDDTLSRWEVRNLAAGSSLVVILRGLPTRRTWVPAGAALMLVIVLSAALLVGFRRSHAAT